MSSSRTPEGPLNYCPVCGRHCQTETSPLTEDMACPRCGALLWPNPTAGDSPSLPVEPQPESAELLWESWTPRQLGFQVPETVSWGDIRAWETAFGVELPISLSQALVVQNGGRLSRTLIDILPLQNFSTIDQGEWAGLLQDEYSLPVDRARMIQAGCLPGGRAILDYRKHKEPQIQNLDPMMDGEFRGMYHSFDEMVSLMRRT